jgi:hypothetical protein
MPPASAGEAARRFAGNMLAFQLAWSVVESRRVLAVRIVLPRHAALVRTPSLS